jgi:hypothetical protein
MRRAAVVSLALGVLLGVPVAAGCSDDGDGGAGNGAPSGCAADNRKDIYTAGLTKPAGAVNVKIVEAAPGPPEKGRNALTIAITDAGGQPVDGATVTVTPFMPDHGHGSAVKPIVTAAGGGNYAVSEV